MPATGRRWWAWLGLLLCLLCGRAAAESAASLAWLELSGGAREHWHSTALPAHPEMLQFHQKTPPPTGRPAKHILALLPKPSPSYSLALSQLLELLTQEQLHAQITLINFDKDDQRGLQALALAERERVDLIFSMGSESADFIHRHYRGGAIPVVTSTNKDPVQLGQVASYDQGSGTNIAYTSLNVPVGIQLSYLLNLKPGLKAVGLMYNRNHVQVVATEVNPFRQALERRGLSVVDIAVEDAASAPLALRQGVPEALERMRQVDPSLANSLLWVTSSTAVFSNIATINQVAGSLPVLGSIPNVVTEGDDSAVLAIGIDRRKNARLASSYAIRILKGEAVPGELRVGVVTPPDVAINFRVARRIGMKIPLSFFESSTFIYDYAGNPARTFGQAHLPGQG